MIYLFYFFPTAGFKEDVHKSNHRLLFSNLLTGIRAYEQLGYRAFGTPGKMAAGIAITLQNIGGEQPYDLCVHKHLDFLQPAEAQLENSIL